MSKLDPLQLMEAQPWRMAAFTTFSLSLTFFESVILDRLVRGGARETFILADVEGVRAALSERGVRRVGREYALEPVANKHGAAFHPKVSALIGEEGAHVLIGSGNLTFGGWGRNLEIVECLHTSFAASAVRDTAEFMYALATSARLRHGAGAKMLALADALEAQAQMSNDTGLVRVLHNATRDLETQIGELASELGGAKRLIVASPYWDHGTAVSELANVLGLAEVFAHVPQAVCAAGQVGFNWPPSPKTELHPVTIEALQDKRPMHAKAMEVLCAKGRLVISGSANATSAALRGAGNIEACVVRIARAPSKGWRFIEAQAPASLPIGEADAEDAEAPVAILRATFQHGYIDGEVLAAKVSGPASIYVLGSERPELIGPVTVSEARAFRMHVPRLERMSWLGGRVVLRLETRDGFVAEGFVTITGFTDIARKSGAAGPALFAMLAGSETPADVAAIWSWFREDPKRLFPSSDVSGGGGEPNEPNAPVMVPVGELTPLHARGHADDGDGQGSAEASWKRFMQDVRAAFREKRGRFPAPSVTEDGDEPSEDETTRRREVAAEERRALVIFEDLFELMLTSEVRLGSALMAYDLAQYVCERLAPDPQKARKWLRRAIDVASKQGVPEDRTLEFAAAVLVHLGSNPEPGGEGYARARLIRLGVDLTGLAPQLEANVGFLSVLTMSAPPAVLWRMVGEVRTIGEQVQAYCAALDGDHEHGDYSAWLAMTGEEWPVLEAALTSADARKRINIVAAPIKVCPKHSIALPILQLRRLERERVASTKNCCSRILVCNAPD